MRYSFAMVLALAASSAFMTPISPINTLVATARNDRSGGFVRVGFSSTFVAKAVSVVMVAWLLPHR